MILDDIAASTRKRVAAAREQAPFERIRDAARAGAGDGAAFPFEAALAPASPAREGGKPAFICEVKKASPSRGLIAGNFPYLDIARDYAAAGAAAISVLTEPDFFLGSDEYLREIAGAVKTPVLRKDFMVDPYQIYEAKLLGAAAVLFICALLDRETLARYLEITRELGLSALVEAHTEDEVKQAVDAGARIIGINNRDLKTFTVDIAATGRLRRFIPAGVLVVSESGITTPEDIRFLCRFDVDAFLIGESLMRAADKKQYLYALREAGAGGGGRGRVCRNLKSAASFGKRI